MKFVNTPGRAFQGGYVLWTNFEPLFPEAPVYTQSA